jgi:hypothetical protein
MPAFLEELRIERLALGAAVVDLLFRRSARDADAALHVLRKDGETELVLIA